MSNPQHPHVDGAIDRGSNWSPHYHNKQETIKVKESMEYDLYDRYYPQASYMDYQ